MSKNITTHISIAERPGIFGKTIFNASFKELGLNFTYKPLKVIKKKLPQIIKKIKKENIYGCGVSMPHKIEIIKYLDKIDKTAKKIGAVNTVLNNNGVLCGYNTDYNGAKLSIKEKYNVKNKKVLLIGAGGVSRAIIVALKDSGVSKIFISNRDENKSRELAQEFNLIHISYKEINKYKADLFINATPVGMTPNEQEMIIGKNQLKNYKAVMDVVLSPLQTRLIKTAEDLNKITIQGYRMSLHQAAAQFKLYTGQSAPMKIIEEKIKEIILNK